MVLSALKQPLELRELPKPEPKMGQVRLKVEACALCRTDLHILAGELPPPSLPLILGHQIVGEIEALGPGVKHLHIGDRVGVSWLGGSCGTCPYCQTGKENLCDRALFTGYTIGGGFAEYCCANARFVFPIPSGFSSLEAAPLLCAGLIGYRALRMAPKAQRIGFFGFGSAAHLLIQVVRARKGEVYAFTKPHDISTQEFAKGLGASWAGSSEELPPYPLDAALIFASDGTLVPQALKAVRKGGTVVCVGIHMTPIPSFSYELLWHEKILRSVANLTRRDGEEFLSLAPTIPLVTQVTAYPLEQLNEAIFAFKEHQIRGSAVIFLGDPS